MGYTNPAWFYAYNGSTGGTGTYNNYSGFVPWGSLVGGSSTTQFYTITTTSGGYYKAPVNGIYHFETSVLNYPHNRSGVSDVWFAINSSTGNGQAYGFGYIRKNSMPTHEHLSTSATIKLTANDTVKVRVGNIDLYTVGHHSYFTGVLVKEL